MGLDRDFLSMLQGRPVLERCLGEDAFGNETYDAPEVIAAYVGDVQGGFGDSAHDIQDTDLVYTSELTTDAIGIKVKDKFTLQGVDAPMFVTSESTANDEFGAALYQTVSISTVKRG